jgi:hypothetical protein
MKKQAILITLGALLTLAMTASSFAQGNRHARHAHSGTASPSSGYYDSTVPEGNYTAYPYSYDSNVGLSGAMGGIGR